MPLKVIKSEKKGNISFNSAVGNYEGLHAAILKVLGKDAPFAEIGYSGNSIVWKAPAELNFKSLMDAPIEIQGELGQMWEQLKKDYSEKLSPQRMEYVLNIPDLSFIYYADTGSQVDASLSHRYIILITGWACSFSTNMANPGEDSLRKRIHEASNRLQNVVVKPMNADGTPICNGDFTYTYENTVTKHVTSLPDGNIHQGLCLVGSRLAYTYEQTGQICGLTVLKNIEEYPLVFSPKTRISISVEDQKGNPVQSHRLNLEYGPLKQTVYTDGHGHAAVDDIIYSDPNLLVTVEVDGLGKECFKVTYPSTDIKMTVQVPEEICPKICVFRSGDPVPSYSIKLSGAVEGTYATDDKGAVQLGPMKQGESFSVECLSDKFNESFGIVEGKTDYIINLPDQLQECYLKVLQSDSQTPVPNYLVNIEGANGSRSYYSNEEGMIFLGQYSVGARFKAITSDNNIVEYTVVGGMSTYPLVLHADSEYRIKIVTGKELIPVPDFTLNISSETVQGFFRTNNEGIISIGTPNEGAIFKCDTTGDDYSSVFPFEFTIEPEKYEYIIELPLLGEYHKGDIVVRYLDTDRKTPIHPAQITLTNGKKETFVHETDADGCILVPRSFFTDQEKVNFHSELYDNRTIKDVKFEYDKNCDHYDIYIIEPIRWRKLLWLLLLPLILCLSLIQCERDITFEVEDQAGNPAVNSPVQMDYTEYALYKNGELFYTKDHTYSGTTDMYGKCTFKDVPCSVYSYIFHSFKKATVTAYPSVYIPGYSSNNTLSTQSLQTKSDVGAYVNVRQSPTGKGSRKFMYHWRKNVKVTIDNSGYQPPKPPVWNTPTPEPAPQPTPPPAEPTIPCEDQGDTNYDSKYGENKAATTYDMKKEGGTFLFEYDTNTWADHIIIYDGSQSQVEDGTATVIFDYNGATGDRVFYNQIVEFTSRYIHIEVIGGSCWEYTVHCPN